MHQHITNRLYEFVPINRLSWASSNCIFTMAVYWVYISLLTHWFSCLSDKKKKKKNECNEPHTQTKTKKAQIIQCFSSHQTLNINTGTKFFYSFYVIMHGKLIILWTRCFLHQNTSQLQWSKEKTLIQSKFFRKLKSSILKVSKRGVHSVERLQKKRRGTAIIPTPK